MRAKWRILKTTAWKFFGCGVSGFSPKSPVYHIQKPIWGGLFYKTVDTVYSLHSATRCLQECMDKERALKEAKNTPDEIIYPRTQHDD